MTAVALDTSLAVPLLVQSHDFYDAVRAWLGPRTASLSGHAVAETYSVLTRLPGDVRRAPADVVRLFEASFDEPVLLSAATSRRLPQILAGAGIQGGAVCDALVGLAAREHGLVLGTRDARAKQTYDLLGVDVEVVA